MNGFGKFVLVGILMLLGIVTSFSIVSASQGCEITYFGTSHQGSVWVGTHVHLEGRSTCGTVRFEVNGQPRAEIGSSNQTETFKSEEFGAGSYRVCFVARGNGDWGGANRSCFDLTVTNSEINPRVVTRFLEPAYDYCVWNVTQDLSGFAPNMKVYASVSGDVRNCQNQPVSIGYHRWEIGTTDSSGNYRFSIRHGEWGSYNYTFEDAAGNRASNFIRTQNTFTGGGNDSGNNEPPQQPTTPLSNNGNNNNGGNDSGGGNQNPCDGCVRVDLEVNHRGRVTLGGVANRIRSGYGTEYPKIGEIPPGGEFIVRHGPEYGDGYEWWLVDHQGVLGWTAAGANGEPWLEKVGGSSGGENQRIPTSTPLPDCHPTSGCIQFVTRERDGSRNRWWPDAVYRETATRKVCTGADFDTVLEFNLDYGAWSSYDINSFRLYAVYLTAPINEFFNPDNRAEVRPSSGDARLTICVPHQLNGYNF